MKSPRILLKDHLLMPIVATELRIEEVRQAVTSHSSVTLNGLFVMLDSFIESMAKEVLGYYLKYDLDAISAKKTLAVPIRTFMEHQDFELLQRVVVDHVDKMRFHELLDLLYGALRIKKPKSHQVVLSIRQRRNDLIHRNLEMDFKRRHPKEAHVDEEYLRDVIFEYSGYTGNLRDQISKKYAKSTRLNALKNLWHYTFATPLCSNFDDYWYIDAERDSVIGYKTSSLEVGLSSSETFMLGIWRSQVSGYEVEFPNMASLGKHMQSCLYVLLKLSNDLFFYEDRSPDRVV